MKLAQIDKKPGRRDRDRPRNRAALGRFTLCLLLAGLSNIDLPLAEGAAEGPTPDVGRELRIRDQIVDAILDGEAVDIRASDGQVFLGIYTEAVTTPVRGTLVILHGRGFHPDWPNVVHPLRVGLTQHGWNTLSIQLPVLQASATYFDYLPTFPAAVPRIDAALAVAREATDGKVVLVAHSCGFHMAQHWLHQRNPAFNRLIDGFIGIGMGATDYGQPMREPFAFAGMAVPVLDVYAENDFPAVHHFAPERLAGLHAGGNPANEQRVVPHADHYFVDRGNDLVKVIADWLQSL